tara:strand:- start:168 stop:353 length:186 start_codon:yes stop_codon:yes gene_type:complete
MNKKYKITFKPMTNLSYTYTINAEDEDDAYDIAKQELRFQIGYDEAKDWECSDSVEINKNE